MKKYELLKDLWISMKGDTDSDIPLLFLPANTTILYEQQNMYTTIAMCPYPLLNKTDVENNPAWFKKIEEEDI